MSQAAYGSREAFSVASNMPEDQSRLVARIGSGDRPVSITVARRTVGAGHPAAGDGGPGRQAGGH